MRRVAVIPGDGVGQEVMPQALRVLATLDASRELRLDAFDFGADRWLATGVGLPEGQVEAFRRDYAAILFGAVGDPRVPGQAHAREILLALRFGLDLYVNFRPCRLRHERLGPLKGKGPREVDFVIFRENTQGFYTGGGRIEREGAADELSVAEEPHTRAGVERLIRAGFEWARAHGKRRVTLSDKSNAVPAHGLWLRTFREVARGYPELEARHVYVDALAMDLVRKPEDFQVIVTTNLFGDILSDLGAALIGGPGLAPSANLNPDSTPLFEPVHGSAPDIAGKGVVNPFAMLLTLALMLETLGLAEDARRVEGAVDAALAAGEVTVDLGGTLSTVQATDAVLRHLDSGARRGG
ncbi:MAG TPA: isocitrate/isopropylmalate dehydrogenase family protein [Myxococcus sp.]|nr:isocitrate/isopropylmalate dehydrogenase family protein [Myxococcus sp.]